MQEGAEAEQAAIPPRRLRISIGRAGGYEELRLLHDDPPTPGPGEVLVEAAGVGVNYADVCVRMGLYASAARYVGWPITPGPPSSSPRLSAHSSSFFFLLWFGLLCSGDRFVCSGFEVRLFCVHTHTHKGSV